MVSLEKVGENISNTVGRDLSLVMVTGFLASLQWFFMFALPMVQVMVTISLKRNCTVILCRDSAIDISILMLMQAARVTRAGRWLVRTGLEIRSRPYNYKDTPQLELDSFITYSSTIDFSVCTHVHIVAMG